MNSKLKDLVLNEQCELAVTLMLGQKWSVRKIVDLILDAINLNRIWERVENEGHSDWGSEHKVLEFFILSEYTFYIDKYDDDNDVKRLIYNGIIFDEEDAYYNKSMFKAKCKQRVISQLERDINTKFRDLIVQNYKNGI